MTPDQRARLLGVVRAEHRRTSAQITSLDRSVAAIVEGAELNATDDEHDPEGATIAYERAQAMALLGQARLDLGALAEASTRLEAGEDIACERCGRDIGIERLLALPTTRRCIGCAAAGDAQVPQNVW